MSLKIAAKLVLLVIVLLITSSIPSHDEIAWSSTGMTCATNRQFLDIPVYLDEEFSDAEERVIASGFEEWRLRSGGIVNFHIDGKTRHELIINRFFFGPTNSTFVYRVSAYESIAWDKRILGFTSYNAYILIPSRFTNYQEMKAVSMHETGHVIGLEHTEYVEDLMFSLCIRDACEPRISPGDLTQVCKVIREMKENDGKMVNTWR